MDEDFSLGKGGCKKQNLLSWDCCLHVPVYQDLEIIGHHIKGVMLNIFWAEIKS
jgi:hypothetical protein